LRRLFQAARIRRPVFGRNGSCPQVQCGHDHEYPAAA